MTASPPTQIISPADIGLPSKFSKWRPGQWPSVETAVTSDRKFIAQCAPTGFGKSLYAGACAILAGGRGVFCTSTKALQKQYMDDFIQCGMADMRGQTNYTCNLDHNISCGEGRILNCKDAGCNFRAARGAYMGAGLSVTNYAYLLSSALHGEGSGPITSLILDECHNAVQELCAVVEIHLDHSKYSPYYGDRTPPYDGSVAEWRTWAKWLLPDVQKALDATKSASQRSGRALNTLDTLVKALDRIASMPEDWIVENSRGETTMAPLWPTDFAETLLFAGAEKVYMLSATLVPKTLQLLGVAEKDSLFLTQDYVFNPRRCPVYLFGPSRIDSKSSDGALSEWVARMDSVIARRLDRKGIIHCTSYEKQEYIHAHSAYARHMIVPRRAWELPTAIEEFKEAAYPRILLSPSVTTGYDFPYTDAEYQIIGKVPFIDARPPITAARAKADPEYLPYLTAQSLVQACGRGMRAADDQCETFILDSHMNWFIRPRTVSKTGKYAGGYRHLFPSWFLKQLQWPNGQPQPLPKLAECQTA